MRKNLYRTFCMMLLALLMSVNAVAGDENLVFNSYDASNGLADNSSICRILCIADYQADR